LSHLPIIETATTLPLQYIKLCNICQTVKHREERALAVECMHFIQNNIETIHKQISLQFKFITTPTTTTISYHQKVALSVLQRRLWSQLSFPHDTDVRSITYRIILLIQAILLTPHQHTTPRLFSLPKTTSKPTIIDQIIHNPTRIIDTYTRSLQQNYYYPLALDPAKMSEETTVNAAISHEKQLDANLSMDDKSLGKLPTSEEKKPPEIITVEHDLSVIADLIQEVEAEEAPTQTNSTDPNQESNVKGSFYRHRFALYRKNVKHQSELSQIQQFRSFAKCLKATDHSIQILPFRSDMNVHSLSTTDQMNSLEQVGLHMYFKPYKSLNITSLVTITLQPSFHLKSSKLIRMCRRGSYRTVIACSGTAARLPTWFA